MAINVWIGEGVVDGPEGSPTATPEQIAPVYWDLHENRDRSEAVFNAWPVVLALQRRASTFQP
ncbi:hypothetical protein ACFYTC_19115 [Actinomadura nitritigenes]|uniref:hypothetical protein n=1 Tax=Actinomadura nitritigenes TaxID=134602 RepID=UPI0036A29083